MYTACASQNQYLTQSVINQVLALHSQHISRRVADPCSKALASPATGLKNFRGLEEALMTVGGFGLRGITNRLTCYLPGRKSGLGWLTQGKIAKFSEDILNCHKNYAWSFHSLGCITHPFLLSHCFVGKSDLKKNEHNF